MASANEIKDFDSSIINESTDQEPGLKSARYIRTNILACLICLRGTGLTEIPSISICVCDIATCLKC